MDPLPGDPSPTASLDDVRYSAELGRRPCRSRDDAAENRALCDLAERLAASPADAIEHLARHALVLCRADSAGVSVVEDGVGSPRVRWHAVAGRLADHHGATFPLASSPCGVALAREHALLLADPASRFPGLAETAPPLVEALVVPVRADENLRATLWVGAHDEKRRFDREDARLLERLAPFASAALRALASPARSTRSSERRSAEDALRESEERFAQFMRNLPGLAWIKDLDGRYVFVNDAAERAFGRDRKDLLGRNDDEIFPPETAQQFRANDREALLRRGGVQCVETLRQQDGVHHSLVSKFPIPGSDGAPR